MTDKERELFTQALNLITELDKEGLVLEMGLILEMREALAQPEREWVGLSVNEARDFFESKLTREELITEISEFLEEKNT